MWALLNALFPHFTTILESLTQVEGWVSCSWARKPCDTISYKVPPPCTSKNKLGCKLSLIYYLLTHFLWCIVNITTKQVDCTHDGGSELPTGGPHSIPWQTVNLVCLQATGPRSHTLTEHHKSQRNWYPRTPDVFMTYTEQKMLCYI